MLVKHFAHLQPKTMLRLGKHELCKNPYNEIIVITYANN